jgi:hypothetical protein
MRLTEVRPGIFTGNILNPLVLTPAVITVPVCTMTRIAKVREHDLYFDEHNNLIGTDWDFWIRLAVHAHFGYLDQLTCKYRIHTANITRTTGAEKRRNDQLYRQMKILHLEWFTELKSNTKELFFLDLLTNTLTGDTESQLKILQHKQFAGIRSSKQAELWRMVGIDALRAGRNSKQVKYFLEESLKLNPNDPKTLSLLQSLHAGRWLALTLVNLWHLFLRLKKRTVGSSNSQSERLQVLLGHK